MSAKDADIARDLNLSFEGRPELKHVSSTVANGIVRLTGSVPNGWEQLNALRLARRVAGVRGVEDQMKREE